MRDFISDAVPRPVIQAAAAGLIPDWATGSAPITADDVAGFSKQAFADPENRLLPVHSREAVLFSAAYAAAFPDNYPADTLDNIKAAAAVLRVTDETEAILGTDIFAGAIKSASAVDTRAFALSIDDGTPFNLGAGPKEWLPIHDSWHVEQSSDSLMKAAAASTIPDDLFYVAAVNMTKAAASYGCLDSLPKVIADLGTERVVDWEKAALLIEDRRRYAGEDFTAYEEVLKVAAEHPEAVEQIIEGIRDLDTAFGVPYRWSSKFASAQATCRSPWEVVYCGITLDEVEKMASTHCVIAGALVPMEVLIGAKDAAIDRAFSKSAAAVIREAKTQDSAGATATLQALAPDLQSRLFEVLAA